MKIFLLVALFPQVNPKLDYCTMYPMTNSGKPPKIENTVSNLISEDEISKSEVCDQLKLEASKILSEKLPFLLPEEDTEVILEAYKEWGIDGIKRFNGEFAFGLYDKEKKIYLHILDAVDADFFVVHARHGTQGYNESADFSVYDECVKMGKNIIANGDIKTKEQIDFLRDNGVKGVMIGRAAVLDPSIFNTLKGIYSRKDKILSEYLDLTERFNEPLRYRKNITKWMGKDSFLI